MKTFIKNILLKVAIISQLLFATNSYAFDDMDLAFAKFIEALYLNTNTSGNKDLMCLYGSDDIVSYLLSKRDAKIYHLQDDDRKKYKECRIIYVARNKERLVRTFINNFKDSDALTIALFESFVNNGGMMFIDIGRRDFELTVNKATFKASGVKLDSSITGLIINTKN